MVRSLYVYILASRISPSYPAKAGYPVIRGIGIKARVTEYWIVRRRGR
jgi:hypothetical protein